MSKQRHKETPAQAESAALLSLAQHVPAILLTAVVALFVATPILPSEAATSEGTHATLGMLWCLLLGLWSAAAAAQWVPPLRLDWTLVASFSLVGLTAWSAVIMGNSGGGRPALNTLWIWINYGIGAFLLRQLVTTPVQSRAVLAVMVALAICLAAHAFYQYFVSQPSFRRDYKANPEKYLQEAGFSTDKQSVERKHLEDRIDSVEPLATFSLTNSLAGYIAPWLIIVTGIGITEAARGWSRRAFFAALVAALLLSGCLLLTKSRSAVLAMTLGGVLLGFGSRRSGLQLGWKIPAIVAGLLMVTCLVVFLVGGLDSEVFTEAEKSLGYRAQYWRSTAAMIADHPLLGVGPGRFQAFFARYKLPQGSETVADPHNFLLEIWSTAGTPALLSLVMMLATFVAEVWRRNSHTDKTAAQTAAPLPRSPNDSVTLIYAGTLLGFFLGLFLAFLAGHIVFRYHNGGVAVGLLLLGIPAAIAFLVGIEEWVRAGELRLPVLLIGLIVLLVNLLAAGAASFPGVMQSVWILIPLALGRHEPAPLPAFRWSSIVAASVSAVLFVACYFTSYAPVLNSSLPMSAAELIPFQSTDQLAAHYEQAAAADPWAAEPWQRLAQTRLTAWLRTGYEQDLADFRKAADEYARRELPSTPAAEQRENWYLQIFARSKKPEDLDEALAAARLAAQRYPASARIHAELAAVWKLAGDDSAAQMEANEALRLDLLNPHLEFKLKNQHLPQYVWDEEQQTVLGTGRPETAEQSMQELRKALRANP